ncbi:MAG TPA: hypothetical protein VEF53_08255 [Patescibacteria group bacterium]|nr:hypothetical protein [Patescibacteria group bacterium]
MDSIITEKSLDTMADKLISFLKQIGFHPIRIQGYLRCIKRR